MDRAGPANLMAPMMLNPRPTAFLNARLVDPESGYDGPGALVVADGHELDAPIAQNPVGSNSEARKDGMALIPSRNQVTPAPQVHQK